jgi:hypothetical protein
MQSIDRSMTAGFTRMMVMPEARSPTLPPPCSWSSRLSISAIDAPPISKELKSARPTSSGKFTKLTLFKESSGSSMCND